ncbi:MAG: histidine kinase [Saprospiraceae bacterium]|nr:histidine kinase [Saprospiraceae bacterium]
MYWKWFLIFILSGGSGLLSAQTFAFERLGTREGLPSAEIHAFHQDQQGAVWIGTDLGVSRYDGYAFDHYFNAKGVRLGKCTQFLADQKSGFWLSGLNGLFYFRNNQLIPSPYTGNNWGLNTLVQDSTGGLWLGGLEGLYYLPAAQIDSIRLGLSPKFQPKQILSDWFNQSFEDTRIQSLEIAPNGSLYIATNFFIYNYQSGKLKRIWGQQNLKEDFRALFLDAGTLYWAGRSGFYQLNNGVVKTYEKAQNFGKRIFRHPLGLLFCGSNYLYIQKADSLELLIDPSDYNLIQLNTAFADREHNLWIGSWEGALKARPVAFQKHTDAVPTIFSLGEDFNGNPIAGTTKGMAYRWTTNGVELYINGPEFGIERAELTAFLSIDSTEIWATSAYEGILHIKGEKINHFTVADGIGDNSHFFIHKSRAGRLFAGGDGGLTEIIKIGGTENYRFTRFNFDRGAGHYISLNSCAETASGQLYFGSDQGIFYLDESLGLQPVSIHGFPPFEPVISKLIIDRENLAFASTRGDGILALTLHTDSIQINTDWQQPSSLKEDVWLDICLDDQGSLWAGSFRQICQITSTGESFCFDEKDGFFSPAYPDLFLMAGQNGKIYAACSNGILSVSPDSLHNSLRPATAYIREVFHLYQNIVLYRWNETAKEDHIRLSPGQHALRFSFSGFAFQNAEKNRFKYRLLPYEADWQYIQGQHEVAYRQLPAGNFKFEIYAANPLGDWSKTPARFNIEIRPPFWQTSWFYILCVILGMLCFWQIIRWQSKRRQRGELQRTIDYFATSTYAENTVEEIIWDLARNVVSRLRFEDCVIYLLQGDDLVQKAAAGQKNPKRLEIASPITIPLGKGIVGSVALSGKAEIVSDTSKDPRYIVDDIKRLSEICVPIKHENKLIGILDCEHPKRHFFSASHLKTLSIVASLCANKIVKAQAEQQIIEKEKRFLELNQRMAETRLMAVRAQMNPHFIFNSLNSIQECILSEKIDAAYHYLSKFSRLLRLILDYSSRNFIRLDQEIHLLELYLELEKMRFDEQFSFQITAEPDLDIDAFRLPSLLIQPFVENSIWHGLLPKSGSRKLLIHFAEDQEEFLICTVEDNGIGRAAAKARKSKQIPTETHESKGMNLALERIEAVTQQTGQHASITIEDLEDDQGNALGTRVIIRLPGG